MHHFTMESGINVLIHFAHLELIHFIHFHALNTVTRVVRLHHQHFIIHHSFALSLQAKTYFSSIFPTINCPHPSSGMTSLTF